MHGTSHEYVATVAAEHLGRDLQELDQVTLHLGNGASAAAIRGGRPVETSMGLTPLEGLVMGTRAGDLDPGVVLHRLRHGGLDLDGVEGLLHHRSGLKGLAGHHDFRDLRASLKSTLNLTSRSTSIATGCASTSAPTSPSSTGPPPWS